MKDDMETSCMNELFGRSEYMIAQVYVKSDDDNTAIIVARGNNVYFQEVLNVPEITGIQRGVSFVKHHLDVDKTEIYPDKLGKEILNDAYIRYCKVKPEMGENPCLSVLDECTKNLNKKLRWDIGEKECAVMNNIFGKDF